MYTGYYGLKERPFNLTASPRYLLLTSAHSEALSALQYGLSSRLGIVVLVGDVGTGKTTIVRAAIASQPDGLFVCVNNPLLTRSEFFQLLAQGFGLSDAAATSKTRFLTELTRTLEDAALHGRAAGLILDEAHLVPLEILEEVRLLSNIETADEKLLPVVLAGQPELADRLNTPDLRQLKQRVTTRCALGVLSAGETAAYVNGRIGLAGGQGAQVFTPDAIPLIHACSQGVPRVISVICHNALVTGFAKEERPVDVATVFEVCQDLDCAVPDSGVMRALVAAQPSSESDETYDKRTVRVGPFRRPVSQI